MVGIGTMSSKKSETLEIRLSHALKCAFMNRCQTSGLSASETVRDLIEGYLSPFPKRRWARSIRLLAAAAAALSVGAIAAPSLARPSPQQVFKEMDTRHAGRLCFDDFKAAASVNAEVSLTLQTSVAAYGSFGAKPALHPQGDALSPEVRGAIIRKTFDTIDTDHDGEISFDEFHRYYGS
jgi:hypothetical protein